MKVKVESSSDSKGQEFPSRFLLGTRPIEVRSVVDRWYGEQACYYRVIGDDGQTLYVGAARWFGMDRIAETAGTGQILAARVAVPHAGRP